MELVNGIIFGMVERGARVLDLGSGDGELLSRLSREKDVKSQGIEISERYIYDCVEKGISVYHGDFESGMAGFADKSFDYVILNHSMQEAKKLLYVFQEALRIGKKVIIAFPNFAHMKARMRMMFKGRVPVTRALPYTWFDTPNLRFLSIKDFTDFCAERGLKVMKKTFFSGNRTIRVLPNLFADGAVFLISSSEEN